MKILYYDCFAGISGDMNLGAMVDLRVPAQYLVDELKKLDIDGYHIHIKRDKRKGIEGTKVDVCLNETHSHHDKHTHHHKNSDHHHHHHSRNLNDIELIIDNSDLNENIKQLSKKMFYKLAQAEAKVHGKTITKIHFHEVGAVDSIVDIVGAAICFDYLKVDKVMASTVELGGGFVNCAHGKIPVPAPATTELMQGIPVKKGTVEYETTTPTGAVILSAFTDEFSDKTNFSIQETGYGIGNHDGEIPNILRVYLCETAKASQTPVLSEEFSMIECNIDDMNPEMYDYVTEQLFKAGAVDVFITPIIMKKGRPASMISIIAKNNTSDSLCKILLTETTTFGLRKYAIDKIALERTFEKHKTKFGEITVKCAWLNGKCIKQKPEHEDCRQIATEKNVSITEIYREIETKIQNNLNAKKKV